MNAVHNARDLLNSHGPSKSKKSTADSWQRAMNGASGQSPAVAALVGSTGHDINKAKSTTSNVIAKSFTEAMNRPRAHAAKSTTPPTAEELKLRKTAETLVNKMFVGSMLKSMRSSPFKDETMSGGKAGEAYAGMFDQNLAEHAGGGIGTKLVDTLVKHLKTIKGDPNQLHTDPRKDVKPTDPIAAAKAAVHVLNAKKSLTATTKPTAKRADHAASAVNFAA